MKKEIFHERNLCLVGRAFIRKAVRAVITNEDRILMIHSGINGDYKFPGGGIESSETHEQALRREIAEECGLELRTAGKLIGEITEYGSSRDTVYDFFRMDSYYYSCEVDSFDFHELDLDDYEQKLKFRPVWIPPADAAAQNKHLLKSGRKFPRWTIRETYFLDYLLKTDKS